MTLTTRGLGTLHVASFNTRFRCSEASMLPLSPVKLVEHFLSTKQYTFIKNIYTRHNFDEQNLLVKFGNPII